MADKERIISFMIKIGEGETAEVFRIEDDKVLKLFKNDFFDQSYFDNEYFTSKYIGDNSNLAPKVYKKITIENRLGYIMDEVKGELFQDVIDNDPENLKFYAKVFGKHHSRQHNISDLQGISFLGKMKDLFPNFLTLNGNFPSKVYSWLKEIIFSLSDELVIGHSDYMPYNLIYSEEKLLAIDWAECLLGPAACTIARTLNFISDPTDYPDSEYTKQSQVFIEEYLAAYTDYRAINWEELEKCLILNSVFEYNWAVESKQVDDYSKKQKEYVLANYRKFGARKLIEL